MEGSVHRGLRWREPGEPLGWECGGGGWGQRNGRVSAKENQMSHWVGGVVVGGGGREMEGSPLKRTRWATGVGVWWWGVGGREMEGSQLKRTRWATGVGRAEKWKVPFIEASAEENQVSHWSGSVVVGGGGREMEGPPLNRTRWATGVGTEKWKGLN